jgi:DNA-binding Lrp family transcriptional regulator
MDSVDLKLLRILSSDARTPLRMMAREVGLSTSGVRRRIKQLQKNNLIKYSILIDPKQYGYGVLAFVTVEADPRGIKELIRILQRKHEICELHRTSGDDQLVVKIRSRDIEGLNKFIEDNINSLDSVRHISIAIAMETYKESLLNP